MADTDIVKLYPTDAETSSIHKWAGIASGAQAISALSGMSQADVALVMLRGFELGIGMGRALEAIYVVKGRTSMSAELMRERAMNAGYRFHIDSEDADHCTIRIFHKDEPEYRHEQTFLMEEAKKAGLLKKDNWQNWPGDMMRARATTKAIRWFAPHVLAGCLERGEAQDIPEAFSEPRVLSAEDVEEAEQRGRDFVAAHATLDADTIDEINDEMKQMVIDAELDASAKTKLAEVWKVWKLDTFGVEDVNQIPATGEAEVRRWVRKRKEKLGVAPEAPEAAEGDAEAEPAPAPAENAESPEAAQDSDEDIQDGEYEDEPAPAAEPEPEPKEDSGSGYNTDAWTPENIPMTEFSPWLADHYKADAQPALFEAAGVNENHISKLSEPQRYKVYEYVKSQAPAQGDLFGGADEEGT